MRLLVIIKVYISRLNDDEFSYSKLRVMTEKTEKDEISEVSSLFTLVPSTEYKMEYVNYVF